jgi:hypothetical protein
VFLFTFIAARILVFLIMERAVPDFFFHVGQTHVHHLNYGIFLLSGVGGYLLFRRPEGRALETAAVAFAIGLALTFDEFGMWLHLGGGYWQRASFDGVVVVAALLFLIGYARRLERLRPHHIVTAVLLVAALVTFGVMLRRSVDYVGARIGPPLHRLEQKGPS